MKESFFCGFLIGGFYFIGNRHGILENQLVGLGLLHDLKQHSPELRDVGLGFAVFDQTFQKFLHMDRLDFFQFGVSKVGFEDFQGIGVAFVGRVADLPLHALAADKNHRTKRGLRSFNCENKEWFLYKGGIACIVFFTIVCIE